MMITTNTTDRKQMVNEISEHLNTPAAYLNAPTFAYQIGSLMVNRDASISADNLSDLEAIKPFLIERGYLEADEPADQEATQEQFDLLSGFESLEETRLDEVSAGELIQELEETEDNSSIQESEEALSAESTQNLEEEMIELTISYPIEDKSISMLKNLVCILYSKQTLINHATGNDTLMISDAVIDRLKEKLPETREDFEATMNAFVLSEDIQGLGFEEGRLNITYGSLKGSDWHNTILHLNQKIFEAAETAKRVFPDHQKPESEKYAMRSWLVRMGMGGPEYKGIRNILMKNLTGHSAFPTQEAAQKHREKYAQIRKEQRSTKTAEMQEVRNEQ